MQIVRIFALVDALATLIAPVKAQNWPVRPITMIVPFAAGGALDALGALSLRGSGRS